jgi:hypothetical protein
MLTADGTIAGITGPNDCSGGNPDNQKTGKVFQRWSLVLDRLDWQTHKFSIVKPLLDTSIDPRTGVSRAVIIGGPMRGAIIRSAYDASIVSYRGQQLVAYECTIENGKNYAVDGTSSCISVYDPARESIDLGRTQVIVSGVRGSAGRFYAAAIPELLVYEDRLFLYWSALAVESGKFVTVAVRGTQLEVSPNSISVMGSRGHLVHSTDSSLTVEVWRPDPRDPRSNTSVDIRALWVSGKSIIVMGGMGGTGCMTPSDAGKGCFRLVMVKADQPLGEDVFNHSQPVDEAALPSNPQEYTRPIRDSGGEYQLIGHFVRPQTNGSSEQRPVPGGEFWQKAKPNAVVVMFPILDKSLWPTS